jgi:Notch-like protein
VALTLVCALFASACDLNKYHLGGDRQDADLGDGGGDGDGGDDGDGGIDAETDAGIDACVAFAERCDTMDNDCDGMTDEDFDTTSDPRHCGACNARCMQPNTAGTCANSTCSFECLPGWVDRDNNPANGCDYFCTPTNGGVEICDLVDNDCDSNMDEGLDLETDVMNCGTCGNECRALHATPTCANSTCGFGACDDGFADIVPAIAGCEYTCPVFPTRAESCDNVDEDCDGRVDEGTLAGTGVTCNPTGLGGVGTCQNGTTVCSFGVIACQGWTGPSSETCDNEDDDCDGTVDDGFDKLNDPRYCGGCTACNLDNAVEGCTAGSCTVTACLPGFVDEDGLPGNGCEYQCTPTGPEVCDGIDNDCDRDIDAADADLIIPSNFCRQAGTCAATAPTCGTDGCSNTITWQCAYGGATEDTCNDLPLQEALCDGLDGDCDTRIDEAYPTKGDDCNDGGIGACRAFGTLACNTARDGLTCATPTPPTPVAETCNNIDDDCDTRLDEGAPDTMVHVVNGATDYYMYAYEASRPGATATDQGVAEHRSCSSPAVMPWRNVTYTEAAAACAAAGRRLCTEAEWQLGCEGASGFEFPYGNTYNPTACNGRDNDPDCAGPDDDYVVATGTRHGCPAPATSQCISPYGAFDLSGNLREWTSTAVGATARRVRGGGFDNVEQGLSCDLAFIALEPTFAFANLGFRCCSNTP